MCYTFWHLSEFGVSLKTGIKESCSENLQYSHWMYCEEDVNYFNCFPWFIIFVLQYHFFVKNQCKKLTSILMPSSSCFIHSPTLAPPAFVVIATNYFELFKIMWCKYHTTWYFWRNKVILNHFCEKLWHICLISPCCISKRKKWWKNWQNINLTRYKEIMGILFGG